MTDISAASFFRQAAADSGMSFEHEETDTGGSKWPTKIHLKALHPETGEEMGFLTYRVPARKADKIAIDRLETHPDHQRKGVGSALMDEMQRRHPGTPIDHGDRTPAGKAWWKSYTDGKRVQRGRTIASLTDAFRTTASHPRAEVPPEQAEALEHPSFSEYRRRSLQLAKNPTPGTVVWRGETRTGEPRDTLRSSGVGMHWTVNPDSVVVPRPHESERRVLWQGRIEDPASQTIPRSHPTWGGRTGHSMDHEAEVRFQPGSKVHIEGAYVWHGQGDPEGHPVPRRPERTHPDWKWHPVGEHAEVRNLGHIDYGHHETPASDAHMPPPWHGADPHTVVQHEHAAGNHHAIHPGGTYDDIDWDAPDEHVDGHSNAVMTDMALKDGYIQPHSLSHEDASEWLRWHPDRAGIEQRHGAKTATRRTAMAPESYARGEGEDWSDHESRVRRGLSLGHLDYMQAREHGYRGDAREDSRDDWTGQPKAGKGWQPLPPKLYHTTTDAASVMANGLKSGEELGQKRGHGLGGTPQWLSMTHHEDNAHNMLDALHEYHAHLNGRTTYADLHRAAEQGQGAEKPFHEAFEYAATGGFNEHAKESMRRGKRLEPGFATYDEAAERGWTPHPTLHKDFGEDKHGRHVGTGWERDPNIDERHDEYGAFSRSREWDGQGKPSVLFTSNDRQAFAKKDPSNFAVLHLRPKPGAQGFPGGDKHEWRTATGDAVEIHGEPIRRQATLTRTAAVEEGDDVPSRLLNPHGHHIRARVGNHRNVEMVPRDEIARYASQETDPEHTKAVSHHLASTGEMEPLLLHYHPASGEAYLGEGNHRLRAAGPLQMDHLPVRVQRNNYGLPGPGVKVPQDHPALASGEHIPHDIKPSDIGLTTVDKPTMSEWDKKTELAKYRLLHGSKTASADTLDHLQQAGYNTDGWEKWQQGHCGTYACALIAKHPHLRFGVMGVEDEDGWAPTHYFAHDDHHAYDSAGKHPLPYHGIDGHANYTEMDTHPDDWGLPHEESGPEGPEPHLAEAAEHAERHQIVQGRYGPHARRTASTDTPVPDNTQPYEHEHDWLPRDHFFAPGEKGLDPRLFDENDRMHPEVRQELLGLLNAFWAPKYGDSWQSWARVFLAGSEASHWYGNGDLDVLIGVDYDRAREHAPALAHMSDSEIDNHLTDELRSGLNDDHRMLPGPDGKETGPWESTFYVNPGSWDIKALKPYAAYNVTSDEWAVEPVEVPDDFGPEKLPESTWDVFDALQKLIKAIAELPEGVREREGAALYDYLHADRHSAFGPEGSGLYDPGNAVWKALDKAPGKPLQQLIDWKHAHDGTAATDLETAA